MAKTGWLGALFAASEGAAPALRPGPALAEIGAWVRCHTYEVRVVSFDPFLYVGNSPPPEGTELFAALVDIKNLDDKQAHYAPHKWHLYDSDNFMHQAISSPCRQPVLGNTYLAPGATARGYITFSVPKGSRPARLSFADYHGVADFGVEAPEDPNGSAP